MAPSSVNHNSPRGIKVASFHGRGKPRAFILQLHTTQVRENPTATMHFTFRASQSIRNISTGPKANRLLRMAGRCTTQPDGLDALSAYWPAPAFENRNLLSCVTLMILAQSSSLPESTAPRMLAGILGGGGAWCLASVLVQTVQIQVRL